jgi:hypothetical protein
MEEYLNSNQVIEAGIHGEIIKETGEYATFYDIKDLL